MLWDDLKTKMKLNNKNDAQDKVTHTHKYTIISWHCVFIQITITCLIYIQIYTYHPLLSYTLLLLDRTQCRVGRDPVRCWKHSPEVLIHTDMIALNNCCPFFNCTFLQTSHSTTSHRCSVGLTSGHCGVGCRLRTVSSMLLYEIQQFLENLD